MADFIVIYWVIITRIVSDGYGNDLTLRSEAFCKIRYFLTYYSRTLSTWFITLACVDRWLSSIPAKQRFNRVSFARRIILITCITCFVSYLHVLFLFRIQTTPGSSTVTCYALTGIYRTFSDLQYLIFYGLAPPILMLVCGILTLKNIRRSHRLVQPSTNAENQLRNHSIKRRDVQLLAMLLLQIIIITVFTLPFAIQKLIDTFTLQIKRTPLQTAQYSLLTATLRLLSYGSHAFGFFFYTLSGRIFRTELLEIINKISRFFTGKKLLGTVSGADFPMTTIQIVTQTMDPQQQQRRRPKNRDIV
jgi:hypothetical protein